MKSILRNIFLAAVLPVLFAACSTEDINHPDESQKPKAEDIDATVAVDQETNIVTFTLNNKAAVPMWIFESETGSGEIATEVKTENPYERKYNLAGTYYVDIKMSTSNGITEGSIRKEFTVENDNFDTGELLAILAGNSSKTWVWDFTVDGHFGCGESGTDGLNWWSAAANEKAGFSLYDDEMTFYADGTYKYDPVDGYTYVNENSGYETSYKTGDEDYVAPVEVMEVEFRITSASDGDYLVFPAGTFVSYLPNPEALSDPRYKIHTLEDNLLILLFDNGNITWHYRFVVKGSNSDLTDEQKLGGLTSKTWRWRSEVDGHFGCGPGYGDGGENGLEWWPAEANDKADWSLYDDLITFTPDGQYTYDPGDGYVYVNFDSGYKPEYLLEDEVDYIAPADIQNTTWEFVKENGELFIQFPSQTILSYIPNEQTYNEAKYKVYTLQEDLLVLLAVTDGIIWHYEFVPEGTEPDDPNPPFEEGATVDPSDYAAAIVGSWTWEPSTAGYFGCGEPGGNGTDWYNGAPNDQEGNGMYDDTITFEADGTYTFDPGAGGTVYVNSGFTYGTLYPGGDSDYQVEVDVQTSTYIVGEDDGTYYFECPAGTIVSYIPFDTIFTTDMRYRILKMTENVVEFIAENEGIAWKYRFKRID